MSKWIHRSGAVVGGVQRCTRCDIRLGTCPPGTNVTREGRSSVVRGVRGYIAEQQANCKPREEIIAAMRNSRAEARQLLNDTSAWNDNSKARRDGADAIDIDPDFILRSQIEKFDRILAAEADRPITETIEEGGA